MNKHKIRPVEKDPIIGTVAKSTNKILSFKSSRFLFSVFSNWKAFFINIRSFYRTCRLEQEKFLIPSIILINIVTTTPNFF